MEKRFNPPTANGEIDRLFELQSANGLRLGKSSLKERKTRLRALLNAVLNNQEKICRALKEDFNRPFEETKLIEVYPLVNELRYVIAHLGEWMRPERVGSPIMLIGTRSRIVYRSKGNVLIISPWNFPLLLTFGPMIYAISAGNAVVVKPSEWAPASSRAMNDIVREVFDASEVAMVEGRVEVSKHLLSKPFNHVFFTGSPEIGKKVMAASAEHLSSVTLELGGKSPVLIAPDASIRKAARRIAWGKWLNAGQICVAPDYVLVHKSQVETLTDIIRNEWKTYTSGQGDESHTHIINTHHTERLKGYIDREYDEGHPRFMRPQILIDPDEEHGVHSDEIFGPVLVIYTYEEFGEALDIISSKPRPLVVYLFTGSKRNIGLVRDHTRSGAICVNHTNLYYFNPALPFGGSNHSGMGRSHGRFGFETFSELTAEFRQIWAWSAASLIYPPYSKWKKRLIDFLIRWI